MTRSYVLLGAKRQLVVIFHVGTLGVSKPAKMTLKNAFQ